MAEGMQSVSNYLVPATGSTNAYMVRRTFTASAYFQDFNNVELNGIPFRPSGVIIDNTAGADDLVVLINEMSYGITCPAGQALQMPYPAPINHTANITGDGIATVIFVDYPLIPYSSAVGGGSVIPNPLPVSGPLTDAELRSQAVTVTGALTDTELRASAVNVAVFRTTGTASMLTETASGTVTGPCEMVSFFNSGTADATVAGGTLQPGETVTFQATATINVGNINYDATGTTLRIAMLQ